MRVPCSISFCVFVYIALTGKSVRPRLAPRHQFLVNRQRPAASRTDLPVRAMYTKTQKLMLQGTLILLGALVVSSLGGWARRATADAQPAAATMPATLGDLRSLEQALEATRGELAVARLQLGRANAIIDYSTHYHIAPHP